MFAFAPNGDVYLGKGHENEWPSDTDSADPGSAPRSRAHFCLTPVSGFAIRTHRNHFIEALDV